MVRLLTFSSLYPNARQPRHGVFVERRLRKLLATGQITSRVVAPVPWFFSTASRWGQYAEYARVPRREGRDGLDVLHPRYPVIPKFGMSIAPALMVRWMKPVIEDLFRQGFDFDVIDAHYFYPDGVAATELGAHFRKPVVVTARGSDINVLPAYRGPRRMIVRAANRASRIISVSKALRDAMVSLGICGDRIEVAPNGVDTEMFRPSERDATRRLFGHDGPVLLSVGHLVEAKGHHLAIKALSMLPEALLVIVGEGPMQGALERLAVSEAVSDRVIFKPNAPQETLCRYYSAADVLVLATLREGMPNVVLESLACGTPVVATAVGGIPEIVTHPTMGCLVQTRTSAAFAAAIKKVLAGDTDRCRVRTYARQFSWDESVRLQLAVYQEVAERGAAHETANGCGAAGRASRHQAGWS